MIIFVVVVVEMMNVPLDQVPFFEFLRRHLKIGFEGGRNHNKVMKCIYELVRSGNWRIVENYLDDRENGDPMSTSIGSVLQHTFFKERNILVFALGSTFSDVYVLVSPQQKIVENFKTYEKALEYISGDMRKYIYYYKNKSLVLS